jgi:hypothetical protein
MDSERTGRRFTVAVFVVHRGRVLLHRPAGVQLENIEPGHQHIDLIYFAKPVGSAEIRDDFADDRVGWDGMRVNAEVRGWCERALAAPGGA